MKKVFAIFFCISFLSLISVLAGAVENEKVKNFEINAENGKTVIDVFPFPKYIYDSDKRVFVEIEEVYPDFFEEDLFYKEKMSELMELEIAFLNKESFGISANREKNSLNKEIEEHYIITEEHYNLLSENDFSKVVGQIILDKEVSIGDIDVLGRNDEIRNAEKEVGIEYERELIWLDGAENTRGVIILPYDDYSRVYIIKGTRENPEIEFLESKEEREKVRPYYEKKDRQTYIYVEHFSGGAGTQDEPYMISDCYELQDMKNNLAAYYALEKDIDCSVTNNWNWNEIEGIYNGFEPIGGVFQELTDAFRGNFDGKNFKINGLYINMPNRERVGLFGSVNNYDNYPKSEIKNIKLENVNIKGKSQVGSIIGRNSHGIISNSYSTGSVSGNDNVGGLVGGNFERIIDSYFLGDVNGNYNIGGLVGFSSKPPPFPPPFQGVDFGDIINSYSNGSVIGNSYVGGIAGKNTGDIINSYSNGSVIGNSYVGGIAGIHSYINYYLDEKFIGKAEGIISNSYSKKEVFGGNITGGLIGLNDDEMISNSYSIGSVSGDERVGGLVGENQGEILNSYSTGNVNGYYITGGLVGINFKTITNSYYHNHSNNPSICIGVGFDSDCISISSDAHPPYFYLVENPPMDIWDFEDIWDNINNGVDYPILRDIPSYISPVTKNYNLYPSISYNTKTEKLNIGIYIYDREQGGEITTGGVYYRIRNSLGVIVDSGILNYEFNSWEWGVEKTIELSKGTYEIEFNANGFIYKTKFHIGANSVKIYGYIKDEEGNKIEDVEIIIYKSLEFPFKILESSNFNQNYSFNVSPGSYIIKSNKDDKAFVTISFSVFGGQELQRNIILTDKEKEIKLLLKEIKNYLETRMDEETGKMAELTDFSSKDLKKDKIEKVGDFVAITNFFVTAVSKGGLNPAVLFVPIKNLIKDGTSKKTYAKLIGIKANITRQNFLLNDNPEKMFKTLSWILNSSNGYTKRSKQELISQEFYQDSLGLISNIHESSSFTYNDNVDFSKLRRIINDQLNQFRCINISSNLLILPNPEEELVTWDFQNYHEDYLEQSEVLGKAEATRKTSMYVGIIAGIAGISIGILTIWSGPGAVGAGASTFVGVVKATGIIAAAVGFSASMVSIDAHALATENFALGSSEWILGVAKTPQVYNSTIYFIEEETNQPYYLHKDKNFNSNIQIDLNPDKIEYGKKFFLRYPSEREVRKNVTVILKNLLDPALTRVLAESRIESEKLTKQLGYDYFSEYLNTNQEINKNITLYGIDKNVFEMNPQIFIVESFSGPFQTSIEKEHFYVIKKTLWDYIFGAQSLSVSSQIEENEWEKIKASEMPIRSEEKQLTISDYINYLPEIKDIHPVSEKKEKGDVQIFGLETKEQEEDVIEITLSKENPEFVFNYSVGDNYGIEFQLFYPTGTDIDLYVYYNESYIGHNFETNKEEIGFPGTYSGKEERPEIIYIPSATNKTYKAKAILVKEDSNLSTPIKISVLEEPFRPSLLSLWTFTDNRTILLDENTSMDFLISEIGGQKPIENISIEFEIEGMNNLSLLFYEIEKINAGETIPAVFKLQPLTVGNFEGVLKVNSSAGVLNYEIEINVEEETFLEGDVNDDCKVDIFDLAAVGLAYGSASNDNNWNENADLNNDGKIDIFDLAMVGKNYGGKC